jgi:ABC-type Fe3+-hydroxamate transport system substrate-binding protein
VADSSDHPIRIASLVPSLTELLFDLELDGSIVARTGFCIHPKDKVRQVKKVGGTKSVDIAALLAARPSHVVANVDENRRETIAALQQHVPTIVVTHPLVPDDNVALFLEFGRLFDRHDRAAALAAEFRSAWIQLAAAVTDRPLVSVLYLIWKDPWFTISRPTYISAMLAAAGLSTLPIDSDTRYPVISNEDPAWRNAQIILLSSEPYSFRQKHIDELSRSVGQRKPCLLVDGERLSWYGSRAIAGLRYLRELRSQIDAVLS